MRMLQIPQADVLRSVCACDWGENFSSCVDVGLGGTAV